MGGHLSVSALETTFGSRWRSSQAERKFFSRRKIIYDRIRYISASQGITEEMAVAKLETVRAAMNWSLDTLQKKIKAGEVDNI
jgi:hypothetical protein